MIRPTTWMVCALLATLVLSTRLQAADDPIDKSTSKSALEAKVSAALAKYESVHLNTRDHNPWEVLHGIIGGGVNTQILQGGPTGEPVTAVGWVCFNGRCGSDSLLTWEHGGIAAKKGPRVQGHHGQFLAILAQAHVMPDYPLQYDGKSFTVLDLVETEKRGCRPNTELTFKLIGLSHYCDSDAEWKSDDGADWSIQRLIKEEIKQPILRTAPCGGTHRLMGLAYSLHRRRMQKLPIDGQFVRAEQYMKDYHAYAFKLQNPDGSFSTSWFEGPGARTDINRRLQTSGHILEWLAFSLPLAELDDPRTVKAVDYLSGILLERPSDSWEVGPLGHALHSMRIYQRRAFPKAQTVDVQTPATDKAEVEIEVSEIQFSAPSGPALR